MSGRRWIGRVLVGLIATALLACSATATPSPHPSTAPATATAPSAAPPAPYADTLGVGWQRGPETSSGLLSCTTSTPAAYAFRGLPLGCVPTVNLQTTVYSGLYRYDARYNAVPDLADGPCMPQGDGTVIRCRLVETTFQDGTPLTADDVAYTYRLSAQPVLWAMTNLKDARVVDPRTVDFVLAAVDPEFVNYALPSLPIFSRRDVEAAYTDFVARTADLTAAQLDKLGAAIDEELGRDPPVCTSRLGEIEALLAKLGARLYREDFAGPDGAFDPCWYMQFAREQVGVVAAALKATGQAAVAQALVFLWLFRPLIGTGPYRLVSQSADRVHLEAWPGYHGGVAATTYLDFVPTRSESDLETGAVVILQRGYSSTASGDVRVARPPDIGYYALTFNVRPGHLFAERALRLALQLCIDLPRDVDAATAGQGVPVYSPLVPGSWADDPAIPKPHRDTAAARRLIEGAGWKPGGDGVYAKGGVRLAADILVRANKPARVKMADLVAFQARDCGMDLRSRPASFDDLTAMLAQYPHQIPGTTTPFDLYFTGWSTGLDPAESLPLYSSSQVTNAQHPDLGNVGGFSDPAFDALIAAGEATYDQVKRVQIYRQAQEELAAQEPAIFMWSDVFSDDVRSSVATTVGPLDLTAPNWAWQPERMVVAASP
jgi:ABC-type transport system substrate-binding protein